MYNQQNKHQKNKHKKNIMFFFMAAFVFFIFSLQSASAQDYYVSPTETDSIQKALDKAMPGDVIHLKSGTYYQDFDTKRSGTSSSPITITGPATAIIKGAGRSRIAQIFHDHYHLKGFTFDGLAGNADSMNSYRDKLLYVHGTGNKEGVNGLKVLNMSFKNSGGEAIRIRYFSHHNEIAYSAFENTGVYDFKFNAGGKNGESIYVGTSSNQWSDGKNPTADPDQSNNNLIHHNSFNTQGNEAVDIKEGAMYNVVEYNTVTGQKDPESGCLDSRGDKNIFRYNTVYGCSGAGIRLGGHNINGHQYGVNNEIYGNKIYDNNNGGIKFQTSPQRNICGNEMSNNEGGNSIGLYGPQFTPTAACSFTLKNADTDATSDVTSLSNSTTITAAATVGGITITASSDDGNVAANTLDNNLNTRWSAFGDGQWILYDLGSNKLLDLLKIAFYKGDSRVQYFEIQVSKDKISWEKVYTGQSNGNTINPQIFDITDTEARYVKIIGHKNNLNEWNSLTEVNILSQTTTADTNETQNSNTDNGGITATASSDDGNVAANTLDNNLNTRWSAFGDGQWILYDLGSNKLLDLLKIAFYKGDSRVQYFEIQVSQDNIAWEKVYTGQSNGSTLELQVFDITNTEARYIKIIGHKNNLNEWNSLTEVQAIYS